MNVSNIIYLWVKLDYPLITNVIIIITHDVLNYIFFLTNDRLVIFHCVLFPGDEIAPGDVMCDIQTDKAVVAFELEEEGILAKIIVSNHLTYKYICYYIK